MNKNCKKGFTIVELIIVIAVIAILAAVLIPTFSNLIKRANVANDTALVRNLNTALAADGAKQHETMRDALAAANAFGYDVSKINAKADGNEILWDSYNDCFVYKDESGINYIPDSQIKGEAGKGAQLWHIANKGTSDISSEYSNYLADGTYTDTLTATTGLDVGEVANIKTINYQNTKGAKQDVTIVTNSANTTLIVNADTTKDTIAHYGDCGKVELTVAMDCYYENGNSAFVELKKGKLVANENAKIKVLYVNNGSAEFEVTANGGVIENAYATTAVTNKGNVTIVEESAENISAKGAEAVHVAAGRVVKLGDMYLSLTELKDAWNDNGNANHNKVVDAAEFNIIADVDMAGEVWTDGIGGANAYFHGTINGNGHTIKNFTVNSTNEAGGFIQYCDQKTKIADLRFENVTVVAKEKVGTVIGYAKSGTVTLENVLVLSGEVKSEQYAGGLIGKSMSNSYFKNCINNADISATYGPTGGSHAMVAAGILANTQGGVYLFFDNCTNNGKISAAHNVESESTIAGGICGYTYQCKNSKFAFVNCTNLGIIDVQVSTQKYSGAMLGGWGETADDIMYIFMKGCTSGGVNCSENAVGAYDKTRTYGLLTIGEESKNDVYYMSNENLSGDVTANKSEGKWTKINYTATVNYNYDSKTLTFAYAAK